MQDALQFHGFRTTVLALAAAITGWLSWGELGLTHLSIFMPLLLASSKTRWGAFVVAISYYLAASRVIPQSTAVFFGESSSLVLGVGLWVVAATILAGVWALLWTARNGIPFVGLLLLTELLLILPPVGIIGWTNPLMGAAALFPGLKWAAIAMGFITILAGMLLVRAQHKNSLVLLSICAIVSVWAHWQYKEPQEPPGWVAYTTQMGKFPKTLESVSERIVLIGETVRKGVNANDGLRVIIFPEQILGRWDDRIHPIMLRTEIGNALDSQGVTILLGAELPIPDTRKAENALVVLSGHKPRYITARQSVPVSMWQPWSSEGIVSNWWKKGVHEIDGVKASFSICYEDFMIWPILADFLLDQPQVIVSAANGWWVRGTDEQQLQAQHIKTWGKIFGVPVLRALNAS